MLGETGEIVLLAASKVKVSTLTCHNNNAWLRGVIRGNGIKTARTVNPEGIWRLSAYRTLSTASESCPQTALMYVVAAVVEHNRVGVVVGP